MIAAALNYAREMDNQNMGALFVNLFADFKVIRFKSYTEVRKELQLCQTEPYAEMLQQIHQAWDPSGTILELGGNKVKLQRLVRQMFFFDEEKAFEKVFLDGGDGVHDFPWALQIMVLQVPVMDWEQKLAWLDKADQLILNNPAGTASHDFISQVKIMRPDLPVFMEKMEQGWSSDLKTSLEILFAGYLGKRQKIKATLAEQCPTQTISCEQARQAAGELKVSHELFGSVCDEFGYHITHCSFGCF